MDGNVEGLNLRVTCPHCGYVMPIQYDDTAAVCQGVWVRCKGRNCKQEFEIKINTK